MIKLNNEKAYLIYKIGKIAIISLLLISILISGYFMYEKYGILIYLLCSTIIGICLIVLERVIKTKISIKVGEY